MGADGILLAAFAFFAALVLALLIALVLQNRRISDANSALSELLSERLTAQSARASAELFKLNQSLNDGFNDKLYYLNRSLGEGLQRQNSALSENLSSLDRGFKDIAENLARMSEQNKTSLQVRDEIARLNSILGNVKLRGNFGEYRLERILSMIYGQNAAFYELRKHLPNGRIADCALHIAKEKILCIDSKFPLQSYEKIIAASTSGASRPEPSMAIHIRSKPREVSSTSPSRCRARMRAGLGVAFTAKYSLKPGFHAKASSTRLAFSRMPLSS